MPGDQVGRGALGDVQSLGERAQVAEVVHVDAAHKAPCVGKGNRTDEPVKEARFDAPI